MLLTIRQHDKFNVTVLLIQTDDNYSAIIHHQSLANGIKIDYKTLLHQINVLKNYLVTECREKSGNLYNIKP